MERRINPGVNVSTQVVLRDDRVRSRLNFEDLDEIEVSGNVGSPTNETRNLSNVGSQTGLVGYPRVLNDSNLITFSTPARGSPMGLSGIASASARRRATLSALPVVPEQLEEAVSANPRVDPVPRIADGAEGVYTTMEVPSVNLVDHGTPVQSLDEIISSADWVGTGSVVRLNRVTDSGIQTRIDQVINRIPEQGLPDSETPISRFPGRLRPPSRPIRGRGTPGSIQGRSSPGPPPHVNANVVISPPNGM